MGYRTSEITKEMILKEKYFDIPKFQRTLTWNKKSKEELFESIKKEYPIGSVLLYKYENKKSFSLIDGLQRISTLQQFFKEPLKQLIKNIELKKKVNEITERNGNEILLSISELKYDISTLSIDIMKIFETFDIKIELDDASEIVSITNKEYKLIGSFKIPAIIYEGSEDNLANIFEAINKNGIQLTMFDILAAKWHATFVPDVPEDIKLLVKERYENIYASIDVETEEFHEDKITVYEFLYGLGRLIRRNNQGIFGKFNPSEYKSDPIGFYLWSIMENKDISHDSLKKLDKTVLNANITNLISKLNEAIKFIGESIARFKPSLNDSENTKTIMTDMQLLSIIGSVYHATNSEKQKIKSNLQTHITNDLLTSYWSGSGDSKLKNIIDNKKYIYSVDDEKFKSNIENYLSESIKENNKGNISSLKECWFQYGNTLLI